MEFEYWITEDEACFSPIEFNKDGSFNVLAGLMIMTSMDSIKARPSTKRIFKTYDIYEPSDSILLYDKDHI